jgi:hypothetical protein
MLMDPGMDTGPMLMKVSLAILPDETAGNWPHGSPLLTAGYSRRLSVDPSKAASSRLPKIRLLRPLRLSSKRKTANWTGKMNRSQS